VNIQGAQYESKSGNQENFIKLSQDELSFGIKDSQSITKSILKSQRCQRNWDLTKQLSQDQLNLLITAATECPTKQNIPFYCVKIIQDREKIEAIYELTYGPAINKNEGKKNPQVLANTLIMFCEYDYESNTQPRNPETHEPIENRSEYSKMLLNADFNQAIGVASGYVNLVASMMGLQTGCCKCMDSEKVRNLLELDHTETPRLLMGVGFADETKPRTEHHMTGEILGSFNKKIKVDMLN